MSQRLGAAPPGQVFFAASQCTTRIEIGSILATQRDVMHCNASSARFHVYPTVAAHCDML